MVVFRQEALTEIGFDLGMAARGGPMFMADASVDGAAPAA